MVYRARGRRRAQEKDRHPAPDIVLAGPPADAKKLFFASKKSRKLVNVPAVVYVDLKRNFPEEACPLPCG